MKENIRRGYKLDRYEAKMCPNKFPKNKANLSTIYSLTAEFLDCVCLSAVFRQ